MKTSGSLKVLTLCVIFVATCLTTDRLLPRPLRSATLEIPDGPVGQESLASDEGPVRPIPASTKVHRSHASSAVNMMEAFYENEAIHVRALGSIRDARPGFSYLWGLKIYETNNPDLLLVEEKYLKLREPLPPNVGVRPNFVATVPFAGLRGEFRVQVALYRVPENVSADDPEFGSLLEFGRGGSAETTIHID